MKSSKLFLSSLLAAAAMSATAYAETDLSGFSGTIYTWAGRTTSGNDLAYGYYYTTDESGAFTAITYGNSTNGDANNWQTTVQPIIGRDNASATTGPTYQNTLRFVALNDSSFTENYTAGTIKTPVYTFNPLTLGGIIVESGATGFSISANGTGTRSFMLGNGDGTAAKSVFHESFTLTLNTGASNTTNTIRGTQTWTIDENKTFTITSGSNALNFTGATTINGGGTAKLSGSNVSFGAGASIDIAADTTLDLSGANVTLASAIANSGTVTISANTVFNLTTAGSAVTLINGGEISGVAWNTLGLSNFAYNGETLGGRSSVDVATTGAVNLTTYGAKKTLTWNGDASGAGTWETATLGTEPANKPWKDGETDEAFYSGDSVIFDKNATVTVANGGVSATTMEVRSGVVRLLSGGKVTTENGITVSGGTLKISSKSNIGGNVLVSAGGTFDVYGSTKEIGDNVGTITLAGGKLINSGVTVGDTDKQIYTLTLTANSEIGGTGNFGLIGGNYAATTLTLGGNTLTKTGANTLFLFATRVDSGKIKVEEGVVDLGSGKANSGSNSFKASIEIGGVSDGNGGYKTATFQGGFTDQYANDANARTIAVNGGGVWNLGYTTQTGNGGIRWEIVSSTKISLSNGGTINGVGDAHGALDFNGDNTVTATGAGNTISAAVRLRSGAVTFNVAENSDLTISGTLQKPASDSISGTLSKSGSGKLVLSGDNSKYGRAINVTAGTLVAANAKALGTGTVTVSNGATLGVKVASAVTAGTVTFNEGAKFLIDLTDVSVEDNMALTIISSSAISFNSIETGSLTSDIIESYFDAGNSVLGDYSTWLREWSYNGSTLSLTMTIPEPSMFGLLAGLGALALAGTRRRRKKA